MYGPWRRAAARLSVWLLLAAAASGLAAGTAGAQVAKPPRVPQPRPTPTTSPTTAPTSPAGVGGLNQPGRGQIRDRADTLNRRDTTAARPKLVDWAPDDSVMLALLARQGYTVVRFQGDVVAFAATGRTMTLTGTDSARAAVQRDSTILVSDTIAYSDSLKLVRARGDTIIMRVPEQREDVRGLGELSYDITNRLGKTREFTTVANSGADWQIQAHRAAFTSDSTKDTSTLYAKGGLITSCLDSLPHYHFIAREIKRVSGSIIVARPAILYVQDVPVMWLPFIVQDIREGRRSGILPPRVGFAELVRNSPTYRRQIENLGYYFALTDYIDAQVSMDWRSSARATQQDPGWTRMNAEMRYRWLDRFISGSLGVARTSLSSGTTNTAVAWSHSQEFSAKTKLNSNINYVTNTTTQRQTSMNPYAALATIASQLNLVRQQGPFNVNVGGTRRQYPGRDQVDQTFPSVNVSSKPLELGGWFLLTPTLTYATTQNLNQDGSGDFAFRYLNRGGVLDSVRLKRNTTNTSVALTTPFKILDFQVQSGFKFSENLRDFPQIITVRDVADTSRRQDRVFARTFESSADFDMSIGLPQFFQGTWNLGPSITAANVDPRGFAIRTHLTNGQWVTQSKRLSYGVGISPTVFRLLPGFGPVQRFRHAITPTLTYSYSPQASVSDEFLAALNATQQGYLGALAQNRLTLGLATNLEAKMRVKGDTADGEGKKVKVVSLQFQPLTYDFERARQTGGSGFATERFGYTFRSDLLPGFDLGVDYSLFQGSVLSDTAKFKPFREAVRASFSLDGNSKIVQAIGRLFGAAPTSEGDLGAQRPDFDSGQMGGLTPDQQGINAITGSRSRNVVQAIPNGQGFTAAFTLSANRQRPPVGGRVQDFDPAAQCANFLGLPIYDTCVFEAERAASANDPNGIPPAGGTIFRIPPTTSLGVRTSFNLTPKWALAWSTTYDVERSEFASQVVTLQRELHDWNAVFGFTQAPNGNFAFTFFISLKAQPEIKLDYDRQSFRNQANTLPSSPSTRTP